jgi:chaperonin GroES
MMMIGPKVLVRPLEQPKPKSSLIFIPETIESDASPYALVLSVGNGYPLPNGTRLPLDVNVGDTVIIKKYSTSTVTVNGEPCAVVMHQDILAVVELE